MNKQLRIALEAAVHAAKIPFNVYDAGFFKGVGKLEGDWTVLSENTESEYAIVIEGIPTVEKVKSLLGTVDVPTKHYNVYYPYYDEGDRSVGLEDAWIIDFDDEKPDFVAKSIMEAAVHAVNWFINNEIRMSVENALEADYWRQDKAEREARKQEES
jgi:hypothetical protein